MVLLSHSPLSQQITRYQALPGNADPEALPPFLPDKTHRRGKAHLIVCRGNAASDISSRASAPGNQLFIRSSPLQSTVKRHS